MNRHPTPLFPAQLLTPALVLLLGLVPARADVKLPALFGDHMVLQQEATLPVWGWADPGEKVRVAFAGKSAEATAGADGKWRADLPALPAGTPPGTLVIAGKNTLTIRDVLVGDVWLCSGQSNMELTLAKSDHADAAIAQATDDQIRLFHVARQLALAPRDDVHASWQVCSPATVLHFSAAGYFFALNLRPVLQRPIGLIESDWGATPAQSWTDLPTLQANRRLQHYAEAYAKFAARYPRGDAEFAVSPALTAGLPNPAATPTPGSPRPAASNMQKTPTLLFDGMIAPLIPFAIKGAIWYQGEDNADNEAPGAAMEYRVLFPAMITDWRMLWHEGDFPFLFVQLPNFSGRPKALWPLVRESQLKTLSLPKTGMAVTIDIGTAGFIHPSDKADVGLRLSLAARHIAYGENLVSTGPRYKAMKTEGSAVRISFQKDSVGGGLVIGSTPWIDPKATVTISKTVLEGFTVAGADQR
jgi:sialate O-acetylesterase